MCIRDRVRASSDGESPTHPATSDRIELIEDFLEEKQNSIFDQINSATVQSTGKELKIRYDEVSSYDFFNFLPPVLNNDRELHGIFETGWNIWMEEKEKFDSIPTYKVYTYLNNLIEKSISNYMVKSAWKENKTSE